MTLKGPCDFKLEDFFAAPSELFEPYYGMITKHAHDIQDRTQSRFGPRNECLREKLPSVCLPGEGGVDGDGDITRPENVTAFRNFVMESTEQRGLHFLMADGVRLSHRRIHLYLLLIGFKACKIQNLHLTQIMLVPAVVLRLSV